MADPSGVARPLTPDRAEPARENSGVIVGETKTTTSHGDSEYKTAFVKVYQDAGVIGVSMLTLLVLCLLQTWIIVRILRMYMTLTQARDVLDSTRTLALEKLSSTVITLHGTLTQALSDLRAEHDSHYSKLDKLTLDSDRNTESLRRQEVSFDRLLARHERLLSRGDE